MQKTNLNKINKLNNPVFAHKYMVTEKGLIFIVFDGITNKQPGRILNVVKTEDGIFLAADNIYMPVTAKITEYLKKIMKNQKNITITLAENIPNDNEIKINFSITLDRVDCATIISLYQISKI